MVKHELESGALRGLSPASMSPSEPRLRCSALGLEYPTLRDRAEGLARLRPDGAVPQPA